MMRTFRIAFLRVKDYSIWISAILSIFGEELLKDVTQHHVFVVWWHVGNVKAVGLTPPMVQAVLISSNLLLFMTYLLLLPITSHGIRVFCNSLGVMLYLIIELTPWEGQCIFMVNQETAFTHFTKAVLFTLLQIVLMWTETMLLTRFMLTEIKQSLIQFLMRRIIIRIFFWSTLLSHLLATSFILIGEYASVALDFTVYCGFLYVFIYSVAGRFHEEFIKYIIVFS